MTLATPTRSGEQDYPQPSEAASKPTAADIDHDSSQPVLSLSRDGDATPRWYVPSAAGLLVVEVAT